MVAENHSERARTVATAESRSRDSRARSRKEARSGGVGPGLTLASPYDAMGFAEGSHVGGHDSSFVSHPMAPTVGYIWVHVALLNKFDNP